MDRLFQRIVVGDLTDERAVESNAAQAFGQLDVAIANALQQWHDFESVIRNMQTVGVEAERDTVTTPHAVPSSNAKPVEHECYVTFDMLANYLRVAKKTIERRYADGKLCEPDIEGGGGKAYQWKYSRICPFLEAEFSRQLPERWPGTEYAFRD